MSGQNFTTAERANLPCSNCGKPFQVKYESNKYCSRACFYRSRQSSTKITCPVCQIEFPHRLKGVGGKRTYCSRNCYKKQQAAAWNNRTCIECQQVFQVRLSAMKKPNGGNFCSPSCAGRAKGRKSAMTPRERLVVKPIKRCEYCQQDFKCKDRNQAKTRRFCSQRCAAKYRFARADMNQSPVGKPERSRSGGYQKALRWFSLKCMICGWDISVDVHHVIPIAEGGTHALCNLAVLCPNHHRMAHLGLIDREELLGLVQRAIKALQPTVQPL